MSKYAPYSGILNDSNCSVHVADSRNDVDMTITVREVANGQVLTLIPRHYPGDAAPVYVRVVGAGEKLHEQIAALLVEARLG